jgi:Sigma-70 region 2
MTRGLSSAELSLLIREAERAASRLVRKFRLPPVERNDLRQDLLIDLIVRLKSFDPARGSLGAFVVTVVAHRSARLATLILRERELFAPVSLDDLLPESEGTRVGETISEESGYLTMLGQQTDRFVEAERRHDLDQALGTLPPLDLNLCAKLIHRTPTELSQDGQGSRASLYRRVREIRLRLMTAGLLSAA